MDMSKNVKIQEFGFIIAILPLVFAFSANAQTAPSVTTNEVSFISPRNVSLQATVNPNGSYTNVWFQIDASNPPLNSRGHQGVGSGTSSVSVQAGIINLKLDTTYYYRAIAQNSKGLIYGEIRSFRTQSDSSSSNTGGVTVNNSNSNSSVSNNTVTGSGGNTGTGIPLVATNGPASVSNNSATVNGSINPNGSSTNFWFEFGISESLGQTTTTQAISGGNAWLLVAGNLSNLETGRKYYYRVVAQNAYGTSRGGIVNFTAVSGQVNQTNVSGQTGQVLGTATISGNGNGSANSQLNKTSGIVRTSQVPTFPAKQNERPSFISLEHSLDESDALTIVVDNVQPKPGEEFSYTVAYKNDSQHVFNEAGLKVIVPPETEYVGANMEPSRISGNVVEFKFDDVFPDDRKEVVVVVKVKENVRTGVSMIFTSVLGYKDDKGVQLATTSYMTVKIGEGSGNPSLSAFSLGSLMGSTGFLALVAVGLVSLLGFLTYKFVKIKNGKNSGMLELEDELVNFGIPATIEPVESVEPPIEPLMNRPNLTDRMSSETLAEAQVPMGRSDIFQPIRR